jgi:hypothetical protein
MAWVRRELRPPRAPVRGRPLKTHRLWGSPPPGG